VADESPTSPPSDYALRALGEAVCDIQEEVCGVRPESAECVLAGSVLVAVIRGGLTPIERTLIGRERLAEAREHREAVIDAETDRFKGAAAAALRRRIASTAHVFEPVHTVTTLVYVLVAEDDDRT
jgi:hypothetical protein